MWLFVLTLTSSLPPYSCLLVKLHRDMDHLWLDSFIWDYVEYKDNKVDLRPLQNKWNLENIYVSYPESTSKGSSDLV